MLNVECLFAKSYCPGEQKLLHSNEYRRVQRAERPAGRCLGAENARQYLPARGDIHMKTLDKATECAESPALG